MGLWGLDLWLSRCGVQSCYRRIEAIEAIVHTVVVAVQISRRATPYFDESLSLRHTFWSMYRLKMIASVYRCGGWCAVKACVAILHRLG